MSDIDKPLPSDGPNVMLTIRMIMNGKEVGSIIGKGGEIINSIREDSGAKIHISDGSMPERIVTVTGSTDAIFKSFNLICKKLEDEGFGNNDGGSSRSSKSGSVTLKLIVPASQCGSLIGKGGSKIKEIREVTGTSVQVASDMLPNSTERTVSVNGTRSNVTQCIYHICCVMLESPPKGTTIPYTPKAGLLGSSVGGSGRSSRGSHQDNPLASLLTLGGGASTLAAIASLAGSQIRDRRPSDRDHDRGGGSTQTYEIYVPNDMIGCIIGKGGSKIAEIRQLSGAMIRISKSDDGPSDRGSTSASSSDSSAERQITVSGNADSVALAKSLINMSLDLHKSKLEERGSSEGPRERGEASRDRYGGPAASGSAAAQPLGLAQLLAKPDALTTALTTLASLSSLTSLGAAGGLLSGLGMASPASTSGHVTGVHRRGGSGGGHRSHRDDDRGGREAKRSKFSPY